MISIGFMNLNRNSEKNYFFEIAKIANNLGCECYQFTPSNINPLSEKVTGYKFNHETSEWVKSEFPIPSIIYDRCFYGEDSHSKQCMAIVHWLKSREDIIFLGYGLPNKLDLYHSLSKSKLAPYLPKSIGVYNGPQVLQLLQTIHPLILKPVDGSGGHGIYYIEKTNNDIIIKTEKKSKQIHTCINEKQAISFFNQLFHGRNYLAQPYLNLVDADFHPFDIRALLQKNEFGNWITVGKGFRKGKQHGILSNLSTGAEIIDYDKWFQTRSKAFKNYISNELEEIYRFIPEILEEVYPPLFELGVDIGLAKDGSLWILDINSKPGRKVILDTNPTIKEQL